MSTYDAVLNAPDRQTRQEALDKLCEEKIAEGIRKTAAMDSLHLQAIVLYKMMAADSVVGREQAHQAGMDYQREKDAEKSIEVFKIIIREASKWTSRCDDAKRIPDMLHDRIGWLADAIRFSKL